MNLPADRKVAQNNSIDGFLNDMEPFFYKTPITYVDVGAYNGSIFRDLMQSAMKVRQAVLIEPNPTSFEALEETVRTLEAGDLATCLNLAASNQPGQLRFQALETMTRVVGSGGETDDIEDTGSPAARPENPRFEVGANTLDTLLEEVVTRNISLLKIDVEGHERAVLEGAKGLLDAQRIDLIYIEAGIDPDNTQQTWYRDIEDILRGHGYRLFRIYEQMNEWMEDSPVLRRINMAFMSDKFSARHPLKLSRELHNMRQNLSSTRSELKQVRQEQESGAKALERQEEKHTRLAAQLEQERAAAAKTADALKQTLEAREAELAHIVTVMEEERGTVAESLDALEDRLHNQERTAVQAEAKAARITEALERERATAAKAAAALQAQLKEEQATAEKTAAALQAQLKEEQATAEKTAAALQAGLEREMKAAKTLAEEKARLEARLAEKTDEARTFARERDRTRSELAQLREYGRMLEGKYADMLTSSTWRAMEPVRRVMRALKGRQAPAPFVPRLAPDSGSASAPDGTADQTSTPASAQMVASLPVNDLIAKLWGGFSEPAEADLTRLADSTLAGRSDRTKAAWNLARWEAADGNWTAALAHLKRISHLDKSFYRSKRCRIMVIEASLRTGEIDKAIEYAEYGLKSGPDGNYLCGIANAQLKRKAPDADRLATLNRAYAGAHLVPLSLTDPAKGLVFGNLTTSTPAGIEGGPKVSVLMAVYNASDFIETAVRSLLDQNWRNLEIVAVDDCSTDDSWEKLGALANADPRLRILRNNENLGAYGTRNRALAAATGEIITVHDSDDWSHPQMIAAQVEALEADPALKITFSAMVRVLPNVEFTLRPERNNLDYVHRSYPSLMIRRPDLDRLDRWDGVSANADDEFVKRARDLWGEAALKDVLPHTPLSLFLRHEASLTEQKGTHLKSLTFGIRQEYAQSAAFWRNTRSTEERAAGLNLERTDLKTPFPIPAGLAPKNWPRDPKYDLIIISDMSLLGGTRRCNEGYIEAATALGLRVGLFHWPRYDLVFADIAPEYRQFSFQKNVDILVPEDVVECDSLIIHHPPILKYRIDAVPQITAKRLGILVNQLPMQSRSMDGHYYSADGVGELCQELFGLDPLWIPISPLTRRILKEQGGYTRIAGTDWTPPLGRDLGPNGPPARPAAGQTLVLGRHSRDHATKWPDTATDLRAAYCADIDGIEVRLMGGVRTPKKLLGTLPANWKTIAFDEVPVSDFIAGLDFFIHFVSDDYIEEFGRNIMEAMAAGVPVILPEVFRETFGDAAVYCSPAEVATTLRRLQADPDGCRAQAIRGHAWVRAHSGQAAVMNRLGGFVKSSVQDTTKDPAA